MSNRRLDALDPRFRPLAESLIARCVENGIMVAIICTGRTQQEQDEAVRTGHSKVKHSRHQDGMAIDLCPILQFVLHGSNKLQWDTTDPVWTDIGRIGESLGLVWGGRFKPLNSYGIGWDAGHFEFAEPVKPVVGGQNA